MEQLNKNSNSRLEVDEDDSGKFRIESYFRYMLHTVCFDVGYVMYSFNLWLI